MDTPSREQTLSTLSDIHSVMERSSRFLSLSGWSGVWAGCVALAGSVIAYRWLGEENIYAADGAGIPLRWYALAGVVLLVALVGSVYFTSRKARRDGTPLWSRTSRQLFLQVAFPLAAGGVFALGMLYYGQARFVAPACLMFYGLALINGGKYTFGEIKVLGFLEVMLGCACLFVPGYGLYFWAAGFGLLHILYGIIMWNRYERRADEESA